ncbi:MAG: type pantothenate kinase [Chloroflexota bacterium]|nr:type pantothenate kinase [Chloroflexota bacterium]
MLLTIDLGNTNLTIGLYQGETLKAHWRLATDHQRMPDEYGLQLHSLLHTCDCPEEELEGIVLSSVVPPLTERVRQACEDHLHLEPLTVTSDLKLNVKILYDKPEAVGADRIADAVAVTEHFGGPACIIDFGTATTFNALTAQAEYLGGAILPGIGTAADALISRTAKLPAVELVAPPSVIGSNTQHAMQAGLIYGYVAMVEGLVSRFRDTLGKGMRVIATGGHVSKIADHTSAIEIVEPWLTLDGLRLIWNMNR